jgi:hypothetical protein
VLQAWRKFPEVSPLQIPHSLSALADAQSVSSILGFIIAEILEMELRRGLGLGLEDVKVLLQ